MTAFRRVILVPCTTSNKAMAAVGVVFASMVVARLLYYKLMLAGT